MIGDSHRNVIDNVISLGILSKTNGQLVLAGDPKQLGPVLRSPISLACGLDKSLLERLMKTCDLYKKDDDTGKFNPHTVTKLLKNFRYKILV